jgi:regulator of sigma E protease
LQAGDRVVRVDGQIVEHFSDIPMLLITNTGTPVTLEIVRKDAPLKITLTPRMTEDEDSLGNKSKRPMLGFKSMRLTVKDVGITGALKESVKQTWSLTVVTGQYLKQVVFGERSAKEMKGPLGIAKMSGQATEKGLYTVLWFMALLSANLGFINLLPIPPLDGGHLLFYAVEAVRGRPMAMRFQEYGFRLGFVLVLGVMAMTIFNDVQDIATAKPAEAKAVPAQIQEKTPQATPPAESK